MIENPAVVSLRKQLLLVSIVSTIWLLRSDCVRAAEAERPRDATTDPIVRRLSLELVRFARAAAREERRSPNRPAPSREMAYFLLSGLAARGPAPEPLDADTIALLGRPAGPPPFLAGGDPRTRRTIVRSSPRAWIVFVKTDVQDKSGSFVNALAVLYVKANGGWLESGRGETAWAMPPDNPGPAGPAGTQGLAPSAD